jgi:hypothetical protein
MTPEPATPPAAPRGNRRALAALAAASFAATALVPLTNAGPNGDLAHFYTDHLHHAFATWVFLTRGLDAYRLPISEAGRDVPFPHKIDAWGSMPVNYPPGMFAVFLPLALAGKTSPMSRLAFGRLGVLWLLLLTHLAFYAVLLALDAEPPGGRAAVAAIAWMVLVRLGLQGFYDATFIGCGAMAIRALALRRPSSALRWLAGAALLHYRAVALVPVGAVALWQALRGRPPRRWPWADLALVAAAGAIAVFTFALQYPLTARFLATRPPALGSLHAGTSFWTVVAASLLAAAASWRLADGLAGALALAALGLALADPYHAWWHGAALLYAPLAVGTLRAARPSLVRGLLVGWLLVVQPLGFDQAPSDLFLDFARQYRPGR